MHTSAYLRLNSASRASGPLRSQAISVDPEPSNRSRTMSPDLLLPACTVLWEGRRREASLSRLKYSGTPPKKLGECSGRSRRSDLQVGRGVLDRVWLRNGPFRAVYGVRVLELDRDGSPASR